MLRNACMIQARLIDHPWQVVDTTTSMVVGHYKTKDRATAEATRPELSVRFTG